MAQNQDKLKLFILLTQAFGLVITLLTSFVGAIYIFNGEWLYAFPISVFFVVANYYLVIFFCKEKENRRKKGYPPIFYYLFGAYGLMSIILSFFVLHFYNVEFNEKEEIQRVGYKKIEGVTLIYKEFDKQKNDFIISYSANLYNLLEEVNYISLEKCPYNLNKTAVDIIRDANSNALRVKALAEGVQKKLDTEKERILKKDNTVNDTSYVSFLLNQKNIIEAWDRFKIANSLSDLNDRITTDNAALSKVIDEKTCSQFPMQIESINYLDDTLIDNPLELAAKHLGQMSLLILVFFQILILLPYFLTRGKSYGGVNN